MTLPFVALFAAASGPIVAALFGRGAFDAAAISGSAAALQAYAVGLPAVVALRCVTPAFHASGDTATPVKALAVAIVVNVGLKILLIGTFLSAGLAFATSVGAWVNLLLLTALLRRRDGFSPDRRFWINMAALSVATGVSAAAILWSLGPAAGLKGTIPSFPDFAPAALIGAVGLAAYGAVALPGFWLARKAGRPAR